MDTPRTDYAASNLFARDGIADVVSTAFCGKLERELVAAQACLVEAMQFCEPTTGPRGVLVGCAVPDYMMARWRKAAGIDTANNGVRGGVAASGTPYPGQLGSQEDLT